MQNFKQLQEKYGLQKPKQIKERIAWEQLKTLIMLSIPDQQDQVRKYEHEFRLCEQQQKERGV